MDKFTNQLLNTKVENKKSFEKLAAANVPSLSATNTLDNFNLENALRLANKKVKVLKTDEAKQIYKDILSKFPQNKRAQKGLKALNNSIRMTANEDPPQEAVSIIKKLYLQGQLSDVVEKAKALTIKYPNSIFVWNILGASQKGLGKSKDALKSFKKITSLNPNNPDGFSNLGVTLQEQGKLDEAIEAFNKALSLKPDYAEVYYNMGIAFQEHGKLQEAIEAYNNAIIIEPDCPDAYFKIGIVLQEHEKLEEAIEAYKNALSLKPDYAQAHNNMGNILRKLGMLGEAIEAYNNAIIIKPDCPEAYLNIGIALKFVKFAAPHPEFQKTIGLLLDQKKSVRPKEIAKAVISLLKFEPNLKKHLAVQNDDEKQQSLLETIVELSDMPLLLKLMSICPLADLELETLLKEIRAKILLEFHIVDNNPKILEFQKALSLQCFTNEYIYDINLDEEKAIDVLEAKVKNSLALGQQPSLQAILCLTSYKALYEYTWHQSIAPSKTLDTIFTRQIREPRLESKLKNNIPILEDITDDISVKVREQYETHPYPRWVNLSLPVKSEPISHIVAQSKIKLFDNDINKINTPNILVAGCGTGQHSIATAAKFKNSKVLGIDLSLSSLAYAKRKTEDLDINNIEYMHADILKLDKLNRQFDIVESSGVLHHMKNPMAGWKVLVNCLKDGGLMKIGLYSALARQHINEIRREILELEIGSSDEEMRLFRSNVINSGLSHYNLVLNYSDFYSLSTLRDLLFHTQEHQFTIPQIKKCLNELNLKFCGFENETIVKKFKASNSGEFDVYNLDDWQIYEEANPRTFAGMYQFWCQKMA
ncbi:MAG: tetratricopeptide repeat protein [Pseudomonadota bacterium]|nr:tetratricopeptide repeat protein [Pseudomonadota bacterium]